MSAELIYILISAAAAVAGYLLRSRFPNVPVPGPGPAPAPGPQPAPAPGPQPPGPVPANPLFDLLKLLLERLLARPGELPPLQLQAVVPASLAPSVPPAPVPVDLQAVLAELQALRAEVQALRPKPA